MKTYAISRNDLTHIKPRWEAGISIQANEAACKHLIATHPRFANATYEPVDTADLPQDRAQRDKWRFGSGGVYVDNSIILRSERIAADEQTLDDELDKPDGQVNQVLVARLQRKLDKYRNGQL